jgi:predicted nucleotidyltransferase
METKLNGKLILDLVAGSRAYGLERPDSDYDRKGIYVARTRDVLSLPRIGNVAPVVDGHEPDYSYYEVGKYVDLALTCNPTVLELLYIPEVLVETEEARLLRSARSSFLSNNAYNSYGKYALSQAYKMRSHPESERYEKNCRHVFRLFQQGTELLTTGEFTVRVSNREELFALGELPLDEMVKRFETEYERFMALKSILPDEPDYEAVNGVLLRIRELNP